MFAPMYQADPSVSSFAPALAESTVVYPKIAVTPEATA